MLRKSLNLFLKSINNRSSVSSLYLLQCKNSYASFTPRDILHETSDEMGTLTARFVKHIAMERAKSPILFPTEIRYADYFPIIDMKVFNKLLEETPINQIASLIIYTSTYRPNADPKKYADVLNAIDKFLIENVAKMKSDIILHTLYALLFLMPNWITRLNFYVGALQQLSDNRNELMEKSKEDFVQLCFYLGLNKKNSSSSKSPTTKLNHTKLLKTILQENLDKHLNQLNTLDLALISNAIYKTSTVINVSEEYKNRLIEEVLKLDFQNGNDAILVTFIKTMRFLKVHSPSVCEYLTKLCQTNGNVDNLKPQGVAHIFAYYTENLWNREDDVKPLIRKFLQYVQEQQYQKSRESYTLRAKDIATFLWCCAQLNCTLTAQECKILENVVKQKIAASIEFHNFPEQLIDCCLYMWLLGHKSKELFHSIFKVYKMGMEKLPTTKIKVESRLPTLLSTVQITEPTMFAEISKYTKNFKAFEFYSKPPDYLLKSDNFNYNDLFENVSKQGILTSMKLLCPITGINIPSIYGNLLSSTENVPVFIEVLTPSLSLKFNNEPVAILRLKIRLLEILNYKVILVKSEDCTNVEKIKHLVGAIDVEEKNVDYNKLKNF